MTATVGSVLAGPSEREEWMAHIVYVNGDGDRVMELEAGSRRTLAERYVEQHRRAGAVVAEVYGRRWTATGWKRPES